MVTDSSLHDFVDATLVGATFPHHTMPDLANPAVPYAKSSLFAFTGAPLDAATFPHCVMCNANSSLNHPVGASLVFTMPLLQNYLLFTFIAQ